MINSYREFPGILKIFKLLFVFAKNYKCSPGIATRRINGSRGAGEVYNTPDPIMVRGGEEYERGWDK